MDYALASIAAQPKSRLGDATEGKLLEFSCVGCGSHHNLQLLVIAIVGLSDIVSHGLYTENNTYEL